MPTKAVGPSLSLQPIYLKLSLPPVEINTVRLDDFGPAVSDGV